MAAMTLKQRTPSLGTLNIRPMTPTVDIPLPSASTSNQRPTTTVQGASLYYTCRSVLDKLALVKGMGPILESASAELSQPSSPLYDTPTPPCCSSDPLTKLWNICRQGTPLCTLYNALMPDHPLKCDDNPNLTHVNTCKASVYHFIVACRTHLHFPEEDVFTVSDLYQGDTNGFIKIVNTVSKILQMMEERGLISVPTTDHPCDPVPPKDERDKIVLEMLTTERKFVQDLEIIQNYMRELQQQKLLSPGTIHYMFGNLNALVDFQRWFLIQMEDIVEKPPQEQQLGALFIQMEEAFSVYEAYCANFAAANDIVTQEEATLQKLADLLDPTYELPSMLIKPIQRLCKYPLFLTVLLKNMKEEWPHYKETVQGLESIKRVVDTVNETHRKQANIKIVQDLKKRIDDWKGHSIEACGDLLLDEKLIMVTRDVEREMHVYFFEKALLICKEYTDSNKSRLGKTKPISIKKKRRNSLQPKGLIYTNRIIRVDDKSANGNCTLLVEWKNRDVEQFHLKFRHEEQLKLWLSAFTKIKATKSNVLNSHVSMPSSSSNVAHTASQSTTSFFIDYDDDDNDDEYYDDSEDETSPSRSRSNSISAQLFNSLTTRPKLLRMNSSDVSSFKLSLPITRHHPLPTSPSITPLPRTSSSKPLPSPHRGEYPVSPPTSGPSSPTGGMPSTRTMDPLTQLSAQLSTLSPGNTKEDVGYPFTSIPINRSHSHSAASPHPGVYSPYTPQHHSQRSANQSTRLRSQSSPNIHNKAFLPTTSLESMPQLPSTGTRSPHGSNNDNCADSAVGLSGPSPTDSITPLTPLSPGNLKIKLVYEAGIYVVMAPANVKFAELMEKVEKKIKLIGNLKSSDVLRLKYQDEDGDFITVNSDDDVQMAFESRRPGCHTVSLFVHL
ncbi:uncharacterized protein BYT42DRAFT_547391 [Radiomyces spectabilis]|uniref:uncharacterized protein n=1 Tax=Radiomyces spectabilis TaxID=64574 RepID=UPI00221ED2CE|nr:uncharacterized protein BYT42DRAFT_547391 [Radiomyces spectabilis]KAI8374333.1 hypothetical protein BYT42DRAFT_547391 [Radiomyces spectabilis]